MEPDKPWPPRCSAMTRPGWFQEHTTPFHWQKGVLAFHDLKTPSGSPAMAFLKSTRESTSLLLPWTVEPWVHLIPRHSRNSSCKVISMVSFLHNPLEELNMVPATRSAAVISISTCSICRVIEVVYINMPIAETGKGEVETCKCSWICWDLC
jgi:hypothetical protein